MSHRKQEILTRAGCAAAVFALAFPGPVLPLTAIMVGVVGTIIFLHRYRCMAGLPASRWYLFVCLLGLWVSTAVNLTDYFTCAPLSLGLLAASSLLCMLGTGLSLKHRLQRLGAFFFPVGFLMLIPYALRASETGTVLTRLAIILLAAEGVCSIIGAAWPRTRRHSAGTSVVLVLLVMSSAAIAWALGGGVAPGIRLIFGIFWPASLLILYWGRRLSDYFQRSCGESGLTWRCILSALSALAPLGIMCYAYNLLCYFG